MDANTEEQSSPAGSARKPSFLDWLVTTRVLTPVIAERVARVQQETSDRLSAVLLKLGLLSEAVLADGLARFCTLQRLEPSAIPVSPVALESLNPEFVRAREIVPL